MPSIKPVRVRLAPSPTGEVHIGTIWIAQFNWLFARQHQGKFILRVEDTDQKRLVEGSLERLHEALDWFGLTPDEGPRQGGSHAPYVQSERLELYQRHAQKLVAQRSAYYCFCTPERLAEVRARQEAAKQPPRYDQYCRNLSGDQVSERRDRGEVAVIRMKLPTSGGMTHHDLIRGRVDFRFDQLDDSVILKSDGFPTYHLAVVVDDHLMEISHVIRAEEWLPSVPKHLWLYQALGWEAPIFAHLPLILGADGSKLSKRHGATAALAFRDQGYLPEALLNFLALMGWHPKGDREVLTADEILKEFRLEDINPSGAKFDQTKLDWLNGHYIRQLSVEVLYERIQRFWRRPIDAGQPKWQMGALRLVQDRLKVLSQIDAAINYIFGSVWDAEINIFNPQLLVPKKGSVELTRASLNWVAEWLSHQSEPWNASGLKSGLLEAIKTQGKTNLEVLWPLRVCLSLQTASPDVFDLLVQLGQAESTRRIKVCLERVS